MKANEILKKCKKEGIKYLSLMNQDGDVLVSKNNPTTTVEKRAAEIEQVLYGDLVPPGLYYICFSRSPKSVPFKIQYEKTGPVSDSVIHSDRIATPIVNVPVTSYENVIALNKKISDLEHQVELLKLIDSDGDGDGDGDGDEDEDEGLSGKQSVNFLQSDWLKSLGVALVPAIDEYFKLQNRKLALQERELSERTYKSTVINEALLTEIMTEAEKARLEGDEVFISYWKHVAVQFPKEYDELLKRNTNG